MTFVGAGAVVLVAGIIWLVSVVGTFADTPAPGKDKESSAVEVSADSESEDTQPEPWADAEGDELD